jgi:hypothetical protein
MLTPKQLRILAGLPLDGTDTELAAGVARRVNLREPKRDETIAWINRVLDECRKLPDDPGPLDRAICILHVMSPALPSPSLEELKLFREDLAYPLDDPTKPIATFVVEAVVMPLLEMGWIFLYGRDEERFGAALPQAERVALWDQIEAERL